MHKLIIGLLLAAIAVIITYVGVALTGADNLHKRHSDIQQRAEYYKLNNTMRGYE